MFKTCQANELKTGQKIVSRDGQVCEVTSVVNGRRMVTVNVKPVIHMTGPAEIQFQAKPKNIVTLSEFA